MAEFTPAYLIGRDNEGGYSNRKSDKGGETYAGISRVYFPNWEGWGLIDMHKPIGQGDIIKDVVLDSKIKQFYYGNFWNKIKGDGIDSQAVASYFYDWSLTSGGAIKKVQAALGVEADGVFGNGSLHALNEKGEAFLAVLRDLRVDYYNAIVQRDPAQQPNLKGWLNRANGLYEKLSL